VTEANFPVAKLHFLAGLNELRVIIVCILVKKAQSSVDTVYSGSIPAVKSKKYMNLQPAFSCIQPLIYGIHRYLFPGV